MPRKPPACDSKKKTGRFRSQLPAGRARPTAEDDFPKPRQLSSAILLTIQRYRPGPPTQKFKQGFQVGVDVHIVKGRLGSYFIAFDGNFIVLQIPGFLAWFSVNFFQVCLFDQSRELLRFGWRQGARIEIAAQDEPSETASLAKTNFHLKPDAFPSLHYRLVFAAVVAVKRRRTLRRGYDHILKLTRARQLEHCLVPNLSHLFPCFAADFHRG